MSRKSSSGADHCNYYFVGRRGSHIKYFRLGHWVEGKEGEQTAWRGWGQNLLNAGTTLSRGEGASELCEFGIA